MRPRPGHPYLCGAPLLIAHRGGAALAPENTLAAFRAAVDLWNADMLEMDVRATRDGRVVVIHDATVDRTTNGEGPVSGFDWKELSSLDAGFRFRDPAGNPTFRAGGVRVPLFEEVLDEFPRLRLNVEIKSRDAAEPLIRIIKARGASHRVLVAAEYEKARRPVRGYDGPWGASKTQLRRFALALKFPAGGWYVPQADALQVPDEWRGSRVVTPELIRESHARNLPLHVWTVDDPDRMRELLEWGIDGIQTDRPDHLARVMTEVVGRPAPWKADP